MTPLAARRAARVRTAGLLVLALGLLLGAGLALGAREARDVDLGERARAQETRQLERIGGQAGVRVVAFDDWLGSLWEGRRLGLTIAVLALVVGGALVHLGGLMGEDVDNRRFD